MNARFLRTAVLVVALALPACSHSQPAQTEGPPPKRTVLQVVNRNFSDFTVFLVRFGDRVRLGTATGNTTSTFDFPSQFVQNGTVRFEAHPIGGVGAARTEQISVQPGDIVTVQIQP